MKSDIVDIALYDTINTNQIINKNERILEDTFGLFIQEIQLALHIQLNEIWGNKEYIDLEQYIFSTKLWRAEIERDIREYIAANCYHAKYNSFTCSVDTLHSEEINRQILVINVTVRSLQGDSDNRPVNLMFNFK